MLRAEIVAGLVHVRASTSTRPGWSPARHRLVRGAILFVGSITLVLGLHIAYFPTSEVSASTTGPATLKYTALGDSITAGAEVTTADNFVSKFTAALNSDLPASTTAVNLGAAGWYSSSLLDALKSNSSFRSNVTRANAITMYIGFNDFQTGRNLYLDSPQACTGVTEQCLIDMVSEFNSNFDGILSQVKLLNSSPNTAIRVMTVYYPKNARDIASGQFTTINKYLNQMNSHIQQVAGANGVAVVDVHKAFNGADGRHDPIANGYIVQPIDVHPTPLGHTVIASLLEAAGYGTLSNIISCLQTLPDANGDHVVNSIDLALISTRINARIGTSSYIASYDVDHNGVINSNDLATTASRLNQRCN